MRQKFFKKSNPDNSLGSYLWFFSVNFLIRPISGLWWKVEIFVYKMIGGSDSANVKEIYKPARDWFLSIFGFRHLIWNDRWAYPNVEIPSLWYFLAELESQGFSDLNFHEKAPNFQPYSSLSKIDCDFQKIRNGADNHFVNLARGKAESAIPPDVMAMMSAAKNDHERRGIFDRFVSSVLDRAHEPFEEFYRVIKHLREIDVSVFVYDDVENRVEEWKDCEVVPVKEMMDNYIEELKQLNSSNPNFDFPTLLDALSKRLNQEGFEQPLGEHLSEFVELANEINCACEKQGIAPPTQLAMTSELASKLDISVFLEAMEKRLETMEIDELVKAQPSKFAELYRNISNAFERHNLLAVHKLASVPKDANRIDQMETIIDLYTQKIANARTDEALSDEDKEHKIQALKHLMEKDVQALGGGIYAEEET